MNEYTVLGRAANHALEFLDGLGERKVSARATPDALRQALDMALPEYGKSANEVIDALVRDVDGGILGSAGGRFFGWVIGGAHPAALAADWLTSAWDQNAGAFACGPAEAIVEEVCGKWLKELLGLPAAASFALVTGCQMAHTTALAAARHRLLSARGWDVEADGLSGAPPFRILASEHRHESIIRSARLLGIGSAAIESVASDDAGQIHIDDLERALASAPDAPTLVCLQAGDLNTGTFDPFAAACSVAHRYRAWVHVDGAFGLWVATSERFRHFVAGVEQADSWAADGHKWLNVPFDSGFVFVADHGAHRAAMSQSASYAIHVDDTRDQADWNPEWSRRGRGFAVYAVIRALGRAGIAGLVERCCDHAARLVGEIGDLPGAEVVAAPRINQGLIRFLADDGDHDRRTDEIAARIRDDGTAWFGCATWRGKRVMRVSVCNWQTDDRDIDRAVDAVREALEYV